jgi:regulator of protease activity HflC (stomatin/prohibitin superfamily)
VKRAQSKSEIDEAGVTMKQSPRYQRAGVYARQLVVLTGSLSAGAILALTAGWILSPSRFDGIWRTVLFNAGAALLILVIGLQSALRVSRRRRDGTSGMNSDIAAETPPADDAQGRVERLRRWVKRLRVKALSTLRREELLIGILAASALWIVRRALDFTGPGAALGLPGYVVAAVILSAAFGFLVLERYFAGRPAAEWPESVPLAHLFRAAILTLLPSVPALLFDSDARGWPARAAALAGIVPAAIALELLMRAIYSGLTRGPARDAERPLLADTVTARLFTWPPHPFRVIQEELHDGFGIDLRQNWAFGFIRRASLPVLSVVVAIGWLFTGVQELPIASRGIYERFGKPVDVWDPGLHWGLPWPLARTVKAENGVVHELAANVSGDDMQAEPDRSGADDPAPSSANRLWDVSHVAENAQVISSEADAKQSFQVVNMDVRFVYRIGLTHEAVMAATYHCADVEALIRSLASRVMVHYFASRSLDGLLGEQRDALAKDIGRAVQADLDHFGSGVELLSVLVESIHPPAGAAAAYHSVQAAQIKSQAIVAQERGTAAATVNEAREEASAITDAASAGAREHTATAEAAKLGFDAEQESFRDAGQAFVRERYFSQLAQGLAKANLVIIDHRIGSAGAAPTIDLRSFGASGNPYRRE